VVQNTASLFAGGAIVVASNFNATSVIFSGNAAKIGEWRRSDKKPESFTYSGISNGI
jgi:hypothetical protein